MVLVKLDKVQILFTAIYGIMLLIFIPEIELYQVSKIKILFVVP